MSVAGVPAREKLTAMRRLVRRFKHPPLLGNTHGHTLPLSETPQNHLPKSIRQHKAAQALSTS